MIILRHFTSSGKVDCMENSIRLSIIVPVYKTEQYLRKCLSSILDQDVDKSLYEVIIVNDGSPDNSQAIIDEYCAKYENVSCIVQSNQGLSMARNNGVDKARGEYIWFVDSDDWVTSTSILEICGVLNQGYNAIYIDKVGKDLGLEKFPYVISGHDLLHNGGWARGSVFYIYKREFLNKFGLRFVPGVYHEDTEFIPRMLCSAQNILRLPRPLYCIYENMSSITHTVNPKKSYDIIVISQRLLEYGKNQNYSYTPKAFHKIIAVILNNAFANIIKCDTHEQEKFNQMLWENIDLIESLKVCGGKYYIEYILFKSFPKHYIEVYCVMKKVERILNFQR